MAQGYFNVMAARSGSPIHFNSLTARGNKFYLGGGPPSSYCPPQVGTSCPVGNTTTLAGGDGYLSLGVMVPGGQQAYIDADGSLSYTIEHSAYVPSGAILDGWNKTENVGDHFGTLQWTNGLIACPPATEGTGWQVFGQRENATFSPDCLGFDALTINATGVGAWQY
ncbi:hypothetical protein K491DRAFT_696843 [Lophiostoma macrostomum CBS 122681]|uniref:Uncharacterized protein n=1 Tax=Lophiostoma macrostomum CBS 122681 TaxID=1314788 RepID=A0A6A6SVD9_9PLEO|nr:hypothetical protein K491DRAFT_696843 [Lophiostoma macrostomum CBS 122681]